MIITTKVTFIISLYLLQFRFPAKDRDRFGWMQFCGMPLHYPISGNLRLCSVITEG